MAMAISEISSPITARVSSKGSKPVRCVHFPAAWQRSYVFLTSATSIASQFSSRRGLVTFSQISRVSHSKPRCSGVPDLFFQNRTSLPCPSRMTPVSSFSSILVSCPGYGEGQHQQSPAKSDSSISKTAGSPPSSPSPCHRVIDSGQKLSCRGMRSWSRRSIIRFTRSRLVRVVMVFGKETELLKI